jgi:hypothetical protein
VATKEKVASEEKVKSKEADRASPTSSDHKLEKGLEDTFPASDVPASTQPGSGRHEANEKAHRQ